MARRIRYNNFKRRGASTFTTHKRKVKLGSYFANPPNNPKGFATSGNFHLKPTTEIANDLDQMVQLGAGWVRISCAWDQVQWGASNPGTFNWNADYAVTQAISKGMKVLLAILFTPEWARVGAGTTYTATPDEALYGTFCAQTVGHYMPLGVRHYELWNEQNIPNFMFPVDVSHYTDMVIDAYPKMKFVDPYCQVVTGGLSPAEDLGGGANSVNPRTYLTGMYTNGIKNYCDAIGHHPYCQPAMPGEATVGQWSAWEQMTATMRPRMVTEGDTNKRMWLTETGSPTDGNPAFPATFQDEAFQEEFVGTGIELWKTYSWGGDGGEGAPIFIYQDRDQAAYPGSSTFSEQYYFGIRRFNRIAKPAATAFINEFYGAPPVDTLPPPNLSLQWEGNEVADWDAVLIEDAPGATITDQTGYIEFDMPTPSSASGDRVELQSTDHAKGGAAPNTEVYYEWEMYVPSSVVIDPGDSDGYVTFNQFHGNENAGYTGGFGLMRGTNQIRVRVEGGLRIDSNDYQVENEFIVGTITRNTWHKIGYHVRWDMTYLSEGPVGFARPYLDDVLGESQSNIATMGDKKAPPRIAGDEVTNTVMFRLGWYPQIVGASGLNLRIRNVKVYT